MVLLTDLGIRRAKPKDSAYTLKDGRGLSLRIDPNGAKLWHFRFYWQGKQQCMSFGTFPDVDLKTVRYAVRKPETVWLMVLTYVFIR